MERRSDYRLSRERSRKIRNEQRSIRESQERRERRRIEEENRQKLAEEQTDTLAKLIPKNRNILNGIQALTAEVAPVRINHEKWSKIIVNMGHAKVTKTTPHHTILCGVSFIEGVRDIQKHGKHGRGNPSELERGEFAFAIVPTSRVDTFLSSPHSLHDPKILGVTRLYPETTLDEAQILNAIDDNDEGYIIESVKRMHDFSSRVKQSEDTLDEIYRAAFDPILNHHLQISDNSQELV